MMVKEELPHTILLKVTIREILVYYSTCNTFLEKRMLSFWEKNDLAPSEIPLHSFYILNTLYTFKNMQMIITIT